MSIPPKTIVLAVWPRARPEQVDYYVRGYDALYPSAKVILLHCSNRSMSYVDEALELVKTTADPSRRDIELDEDTLIHLFGDEAATQTCRLLRAYRSRTNHALGVRALILDSVPVVVLPDRQTLRRSPHLLLIYAHLLLLSFLHRLLSVLTLWFSEPYREAVRRDLHDPTLLPATARQCYIFPEKDLMFVWDTPKHEDDIPKRHDFAVRRYQVDSQRHWTGNQERYWLGVENAWDGL